MDGLTKEYAVTGRVVHVDVLSTCTRTSLCYTEVLAVHARCGAHGNFWDERLGIGSISVLEDY